MREIVLHKDIPGCTLFHAGLSQRQQFLCVIGCWTCTLFSIQTSLLQKRKGVVKSFSGSFKKKKMQQMYPLSVKCWCLTFQRSDFQLKSCDERMKVQVSHSCVLQRRKGSQRFGRLVNTRCRQSYLDCSEKSAHWEWVSVLCITLL